MKSYILSTCLLAILILSFFKTTAQTSGEEFIKKTAPQKFAFKKESRFEIIPASGETCIMMEMSEKENEIAFTHFSKDLTVLKTNKSPFSRNGDMQYFKVINFKDNTYLLWEQFVRKTKSTSIMIQQISKDEAKLTGTPIQLDAGIELSAYLFRSTSTTDVITSVHNETDKHNIFFSPDNSKMLVASMNARRKDKSDINTFNLDVCDQYGTKIYNKQMDFPYDRVKMQVVTCCLGNDGTVYMMYKVFKGANRKELLNDATSNYTLEIYKYDQASDSKLCTIDPEGTFISKLLFRANNKNDLAITGLYTAAYHNDYVSEAVERQAGAFNVLINNQNRQPLYKLDNKTKLSAEMIAAQSPYSNKEAYKTLARTMRYDQTVNAFGSDNESGVSALSLARSYFEDDGSVIFYTEKRILTSRPDDVVTLTNNAGRAREVVKSYINFFLYCDMYIFSFGKDGKHIANTKIPKLQYAKNNTIGIGYLSFTKNNKMNIAYIDLEQNVNLAKDKYPAMYKDLMPGIMQFKSLQNDGSLQNDATYKINTALDVPPIADNGLINNNTYFGYRLFEDSYRVYSFSLK